MNAKGRPEGRPPLKPGSDPKAPYKCSAAYDAVHLRSLPQCQIWPLCLDFSSYRLGVEVARVGGHLTDREVEALLLCLDRIRKMRDDEIFPAFAEMFATLAASTTPERARIVARWSPFDPAKLKRATHLAVAEKAKA